MKPSLVLYLFLAVVAVHVGLFARRFYELAERPIRSWLESRRPLPVVGGFYSVRQSRDSFLVVKVLAIDTDAVHVRIYENRFTVAPERVDPAWLRVRDREDGEWGGVRHAALTYTEFLAGKPALIMKGSVTDEELEGCRTWHRSGRWIADA